MTEALPRVAVVGCGPWGRNLIRAFDSLGTLSAVHDIDPAVARSVSEAFGVPAVHWEGVLDDADIDAVVLAAPAAQHAPLAREVLKAGKHVFVEKPLALDISDGEELCALAQAAGRVLMVGHLLRYHPAFRALEQLVATGGLGRLQYLYSNRLNLGRIRREENTLWSFAPHDISMMLRLAGSEPDGVTAVGASFLRHDIADVTTTHLSWSSGIRGHVFVSWIHPFKEQKLVVVGDRGMTVFDDGQPWETKLVQYPHEIEWREGLPLPSKADAVPVPIQRAEPLVLECEHFLSCIAAEATPMTDGQEGLRVLRVLAAADRSLRQAPTGDPAPTRGRHGGATIHETAVVDEPCEIGAGSRIWHFTHVMAHSRIGRDCTLGQNVMVGPRVFVGDRCKIQNNVSLYEGVVLEDEVFCGPSSVFTNVVNPRAAVERKDEFRPTRVGRGATIGANATIVCGNAIGQYAFVAAGAVVTTDVPPFALVAGVPARRIGWMSHAGERLGDDLVCLRSGRRYVELGPDHLEEVSG